MTLRDLYSTPWNCICDYPKVRQPWRAPVKTEAHFRNDHGVSMLARVSANRTNRRWWLEILVGEQQRSLHVYLTTSSPTKANQWIAAVQGGWK